DAHHFLQAGRAARAWNLAQFLLRQRIQCRFRGNPEIACQGDFKTYAEAITTVRRNDRLATTHGCSNIPRQLRHMFRAGFEKAFDIPPAGKVLADGPQDDYANTIILVESLENQTQLVSLRHGDDIELSAIQNDV